MVFLPILIRRLMKDDFLEELSDRLTGSVLVRVRRFSLMNLGCGPRADKLREMAYWS